jgi:manganese/zinc/iron transport system permease protein
LTPFVDALLLQAGYNAALVAIGAGLLGFASGATGTFLLLRKRALVSDAIAHATLPGVGVAFILMVALGGDGRNLAGLLLGSAISAAVGLLLIQWIVARTRLTEDAAIGAVLGAFFGFGIVLLTVIQSMSSGRQAGLEGFLLGSTAGMLRQDAIVILAGGLLALALIWGLRRPMTLVSFDAEFATAAGYKVSRIDLIMMASVLVVTVIGLKVVGLVLIVALLIIPPVAARFWTDQVGRMIWISSAIGGGSGYVGAAVSASAPDLPTGPIIVLVAAAIFVASMLFAPVRGLAASALQQRHFKARVHQRQGLLALARQEPIREAYTLRLLQRENLVRPDGVPTDAGRAAAAKVSRDERRWEIARQIHQDAGLTGRYDGLTPIEDVFTADEIRDFDRRIGPPVGVGGA